MMQQQWFVIGYAIDWVIVSYQGTRDMARTDSRIVCRVHFIFFKKMFSWRAEQNTRPDPSQNDEISKVLGFIDFIMCLTMLECNFDATETLSMHLNKVPTCFERFGWNWVTHNSKHLNIQWQHTTMTRSWNKSKHNHKPTWNQSHKNTET